MHEDVTISVIIPVYNVERYLKECLDSVMMQRCSNFEVVCINDGSTDGSLNILQEYQKRYSCIRVYSKGNGGLSSARNYGIQKALGKYLFFLDSDDLLADEDCLSFMIKNMNNYDLDALYFDGHSFFESEELKAHNLSYENAYKRCRSYGCYERGTELFDALVKNGDYYVQTSLQCLRKKYLTDHDFLFADGLLYEDNLFMFQTMLHAGKVMHQNRVIFLRRIRKGSIMQSPPGFNNFYSHIRIYQEIFVLYHLMHKVWCVDESAVIIINRVKNAALGIYNRLNDHEKNKIQQLPKYEQYMINNAILPKIKMLNGTHVFPYHLFRKGERVIIYGAGTVGRTFYYRAMQDAYIQVVGIVDVKAKEMLLEDIPVLPIEQMKQLEYDSILIAVENGIVAMEIRENLQNLGIANSKIKWDGEVYLRKNYITKSHEYRKFADRLLHRDKKRLFLFMLPEHGNLGDYAIGIAEQHFFKDFFSEYDLVCVTTEEWQTLKTIFVQDMMQSDVIFITGGGFWGDLWTSGSICREIVQAFPENLKVLLPNTLTYRDENKDIMKKDMEQLVQDDHTFVFWRERRSWKMSKEFGLQDKCYCFPDMVFYLDQHDGFRSKNGKALLCFRSDAEKLFEEEMQVQEQLKRENVLYDRVDTHLYKYVSQTESKEYVSTLIEEIAQYEWMITDRLHGMLLSYIAGTPCIAFDNLTHKVSGVYEWIQDEPAVTLMEQYDPVKLKQFLDEQWGRKCSYVKKDDLHLQFVRMAEVIQQLIGDKES